MITKVKFLSAFIMLLGAALLHGEDYFEFNSKPEYVNLNKTAIKATPVFAENKENNVFKMSALTKHGGSCVFGPFKLQAGETYTFEFQYKGSAAAAGVEVTGKAASKVKFFLYPASGKWQKAAGSFTPSAGDNENFIKISLCGKNLKPGAHLLIDQMRFADAAGNNLYASRSYVAPKMTEKVVRSGKEYIILFKGNSITRHRFNQNTIRSLGWDHESGMAASSEKSDYVHLVCAKIQKTLNIPVRPVFGNGHNLTVDLKKVASFKPDMIVVQGGEHPLASRKFDAYQKMLDNAFPALKKITPNVYCIGLWEPGRRYSSGNVAKVVKIQQQMCKKHEVPYISVEKYANDPSCRGWGKSAGVKWHPNDKGMAGYAQQLFEAWQKRMKK